LNEFALARVIHVIAVVFWIGGMAMVTTVLIPTLRKYRSGVDAVELFEALENNFARQAKFVILIAGASGFYMLDYIDAWGRYSEPRFWWLHAMTMVWALFMFVLFIAAYIACSKIRRDKAREDILIRADLSYGHAHIELADHCQRGDWEPRLVSHIISLN
jgi:uncharacterized membrane protein